MKTTRMGFTKGVNGRTDPRLLGDEFLLVSDNTETRSGVLKPVEAPEFDRPLPDGTLRAFEFRGKWHVASTRREYAAEYVGNQERVYYSDPGERPMKVVNSSATATLGMVRPSTGIVVSKYGKLTPSNVNATGANGSGSLEPGGYGYRVGYRTKRGYLQASSTLTANVPTGSNGSIHLTWDIPDFSDLEKESKPICVTVYGREIGKERILAELTLDSKDYLDTGGAAPSGQTASSYDATAPMRYCYTFERDVGGHVDESGPSALSIAVDSASGRFITFDGNDGADAFVKTRNLYRIGDASTLSLVAKIKIPNLTYLDVLPLDALGGNPDSEYDDEDGRHVVFGPAPQGLKRITPHNEMLFGVVDNTVRWTPVNRPDAWPGVYCVNLPHPPVALASFAGSLIILAQDALYRLDGWSPGGLNLTRMPIEDGCLAPFSVQKTSRGLIYLSARGLMRFAGGMSVEPLTEDKLDPRALLAPSSSQVPWSFWWLPTKAGQAFAAQTRDHATLDVNAIAPAINDTRVIEGPIEGIRSFLHAGRYYLYYTEEDHGAGTTWVVDLADAGMPITTLGLRPLDAHVTALEHCYLLLPDFREGSEAFQVLRTAQGTVDQTLPISVSATTKRMLARFGKGRERIPWYIRSGPMSQGAPVTRKRYRYLEFYGSGTVDVRAYVDNRVVASAQVTATQTPRHARRLNLPRSCWGYALDLELAGSAELLAVEMAFDGMPSES